MVELSNSFIYRLAMPYAVRNPEYKYSVCPNPISLAATLGISFDLFSSRY